MNSDQQVDFQATSTGFSIASRRPIVVVGGGVIGAACAYYLQSAGAPVLLIDKGQFGKGSSHGNCGYISPSHILPLTKPGAIQATFKAFFKRNSPFKMRFRFDPQYWYWLLQFARHCNHSNMISAGHARQALLDSSRNLYNELIERDVLQGIDWESKGVLFVHKSAKHFEQYEKTNQLLIKEFGLAGVAIPGQELEQWDAALKPGLGGAWYYSSDAHLRPDLLMAEWKRKLVEIGVVIREHAELINLEHGDKGVYAINTTIGRYEVDHLVMATGAWSRVMRRELEANLPIEPGKGYSITMNRPKICPQYPMILEDHRVGVTPFQSGYRLGSTMEFAGYDSTLRRERLALLSSGASHYLREPMGTPVVEEWSGWRPMSADEVPMIGKLPAFSNVWMAAGHSMLGVSMAPGTGKLLSELITGKHPHIDPHPYRTDRF